MKERKCLMSWQTDMFSGLVKDGICSIILVTIFLKVKLIISVWTPSLVPAPVDSPKLLVYPIGLRSWPPRGDWDFFSTKKEVNFIFQFSYYYCCWWSLERRWLTCQNRTRDRNGRMPRESWLIGDLSNSSWRFQTVVCQSSEAGRAEKHIETWRKPSHYNPGLYDLH